MIENKIRWKRKSSSPFIKPDLRIDGLEAVTTPDVLLIGENLYFYTGAVINSQEKIILSILPIKDINFVAELSLVDNFKVVIEPGPSDFDCKHVFDPAIVHWNGKFWLYYSGLGTESDVIGLAISENGIDFKKIKTPIITGRSPEVVVKDDKVYLFYVKDNLDKGYSVYLDISEDGRNFYKFKSDPVLTIGDEGSWDNFEVTTPRIMEIDKTYYMIYAGLNKSNKKDIPIAFGLSRSFDLINWKKFKNNPVFQVGDKGAWDDGAIWFGTPIVIGDNIFLFYEGGRLENIIDKSPALTEVGLAEIPMKELITKEQLWD